MSGCNARIYYTTGMRQVASTNLSIGEEGRQKILTGDWGKVVCILFYTYDVTQKHRLARPKILHIFFVFYITLVQKASPSIVWTRCMPYHCWSKRMPKRNENDCTGSTKRAMFSPCTAFLWIWNKIGAGVRWYKKSFIDYPYHIFFQNFEIIFLVIKCNSLLSPLNKSIEKL